MGITRHIAPHSRGKNKLDQIFVFSGKAKAAINEFGSEAVVNSTIGALLDDDDNLALLPAVEEASKRLSSEQVAPYAPVAGLPDFREDVINYLYEGVENRPPLGSVATSGATGALRIAVWDFLEAGDSVVTHDYFWSPYRSIVEDTGRKFETFKTFLGDGHFNVKGALERVDQNLSDRDRVLLLLNTPCHNPTGVSLTEKELHRLREGLVDIAEANPHKILTLVIDAAYWEFGDRDQNTLLLSLFRDLPDNMLFCVAFTMSKSLTRYGFRTGALVFSTRDEQAVDDIGRVLGASIRVHWSNTCRLGQVLFSTVYRDEKLLAQLKEDQNHFADLCRTRGDIFVKEAQEVGLSHTPFHGGFFLTLPSDKPKEMAARLIEEKIFMVPLAKGVRVALCSIPTRKMHGLAARIKAAIS